MGQYYVTMIDTFLSGWGPAKGMSNRFIVECDDSDQAEAIARAADDRPEMKCVRIERVFSKAKGQGRAREYITLRKFDELGGAWKQYYNGNIYL